MKHQSDSAGLFLLFADGKRPDRAAIKAFVENHGTLSLSFDPAAGSPLHLVAADGKITGDGPAVQSDAAERHWLELLKDGLTFDLLDLSPGPAADLPAFENRFDIDADFPLSLLEGVRLGLGDHLAGSQNSLPVAMALAGLARDLIHEFDDLVAVGFDPAKSLIGRRFFESVTTAWLEGGAFPALGFTAFKETGDGALQTVGLEYWIGQELRIEPPLSNEKVAATRLGVRLVNQLVIIGGLDKAERILAPDGSQLIMRPSRNGRFVRVSPD